jgi:hypothetical protein
MTTLDIKTRNNTEYGSSGQLCQHMNVQHMVLSGLAVWPTSSSVWTVWIGIPNSRPSVPSSLLTSRAPPWPGRGRARGGRGRAGPGQHRTPKDQKREEVCVNDRGIPIAAMRSHPQGQGSWLGTNQRKISQEDGGGRGSGRVGGVVWMCQKVGGQFT